MRKTLRTQAGWPLLAVAITLLAGGGAWGEIPLYKLSLLPEDESVYAPPALPREDQGINQGGVNVELNITYLSAYVYRGVDHTKFPGREQKPDLQFEGEVSFNTGKFPHPFVGVFANVYNSDPVSRFQEIRPFAGAEWTLKPFTLKAGVNAYIYPEREKLNTAEVWTRITFDDSLLFRAERPMFSPYVYGAYDYRLNNGTYLEAGITHDFVIEDTGVTLTVFGDIAYVNGIKQEFVFLNTKAQGLQHYDAGLVVTYSLNRLFQFSRRYGDVSLKGYLTYTDGINRNVLHTDTKLWGGVGIQFKY